MKNFTQLRGEWKQPGLTPCWFQGQLGIMRRQVAAVGTLPDHFGYARLLSLVYTCGLAWRISEPVSLHARIKIMIFRSTKLRNAVLMAVGFSALVWGAAVDGEFKGNWTSNSGSAGALRLVLSKTDSVAPDCRLFYSHGGSDGEIAPKTTACTMDAGKFSVAFETDSDGDPVRIALMAVVEGDTLSGDFKVTAPNGDVVDSGTWKAKKSE